MKIINLIILITVCAALARAEEAYNYPYTNADMATLSNAIMKSKHDKSLAFAQLLHVPVIAGREKTFLMEDKSQLKFGFYPQAAPAPLVFIIADMGSTHVSGNMMYLADILQANGYNVVTLPSQFAWNYALSSSTTALPGLTSEDAIDMHRALQVVLDKVLSVHAQPILKKAIVGLGFGALLVAHISSLERRQKKLNFDKYVLINPVVNMIDAVTQIETRAAIGLELGMDNVEWIKGKAFNFVVDCMDEKLKVEAPDYFLNLEKKFPLSAKEYKFLTGAVLRMNIGDMTFASQLVNDQGVLKSKLSRYSWDARHKEVNDLGLVGYLKQIFLPFFIKKYPKLLALVRQTNLNLVRQTLIDNKNIYLIHNEDDFLINASQVEYLKNIFEPERRKIYPLGGHLGNLWFETNKKDLLNVLSIIKN